MQAITPFLWFDGQAEAAAQFYLSVFRDARIVGVLRAPAGGPTPAGSVLTVEIELLGQRFVALNGGPQYAFTPAVSFMVPCDTQAEIDHYWAALGAGGQELACGWLTDRWGLSWQVAPRALLAMLADADAERAQRCYRAMMNMVKLDLAALQHAFDGR